MTDNLFSELFHNCALVAFIEQARAQQGWPDSEPARQRAYMLYEQELASRSGNAISVNEETSLSAVEGILGSP